MGIPSQEDLPHSHAARITLYIGVVSAVVICASAIPVGLSDTSDELSDEAYNLALAEAETALQTSEGNGFGDVFKNLFKTVHNAALQDQEGRRGLQESLTA